MIGLMYTSNISGLGSTHNTGFLKPPALICAVFNQTQIFSVLDFKCLHDHGTDLQLSAPKSTRLCKFLYYRSESFETRPEKMCRLESASRHTFVVVYIYMYNKYKCRHLYNCEASLHAPAPKSTRRQLGSRRSRWCSIETTWTVDTEIKSTPPFFLKKMAFSNPHYLSNFLTKGWASSEYSEVFDARLE